MTSIMESKNLLKICLGLSLAFSWIISLVYCLHTYSGLQENMIHQNSGTSWKYQFSQISFTIFLMMFLLSNLGIVIYLIMLKRIKKW